MSKRTTKYKDPWDYMFRYECKNTAWGYEEERASNNQKAIDHLRQWNMQLARELDRMRREMLGLLHHEPECGTCLDTGPGFQAKRVAARQRQTSRRLSSGRMTTAEIQTRSWLKTDESWAATARSSKTKIVAKETDSAYIVDCDRDGCERPGLSKHLRNTDNGEQEHESHQEQ